MLKRPPSDDVRKPRRHAGERTARERESEPINLLGGRFVRARYAEDSDQIPQRNEIDGP